jgi:hypothetical protein
MNLTADMVREIDGILAAAQEQGRGRLYEHEVYGILQTIGLGVPRHRFVRDIAEVTHEALMGFGRSIMAKIVSPGIPHKQRLGGVRRVATADPLYVQFVLTKMREEMLSHFPPGEGPEMAGFLLVEYVPHTQAIGYEVLVGFREDPAFGPVLTVSKGGEDAEFFATHYDPANLFLPPIKYPDALAFMRSLHIRHKFEQIGHLEYLEHMARAVAGLSLLAVRYSHIAEKPGSSSPRSRSTFVISGTAASWPWTVWPSSGPHPRRTPGSPPRTAPTWRRSSGRAASPWSGCRGISPSTAWVGPSRSCSTTWAGMTSFSSTRKAAP